MKTSIIIFLVFIHINVFANEANLKNEPPLPPSDTTVLQSILSLNLTYYIGKPVDSLLSILPAGFTSRDFMPMGIGYCKGVYQSYFSGEYNNCFIEIFIDTFQFLPIPNRTPTTNWNMGLAKKETIAFIKVWKNNNICMYGCNNPNYYD